MPGLREHPGRGAAGGLGFALMALGVDIVEGAKYVADLVRFPQRLTAADAVILGRGSTGPDITRGQGRRAGHPAGERSRDSRAGRCGGQAAIHPQGLRDVVEASPGAWVRPSTTTAATEPSVLHLLHVCRIASAWRTPRRCACHVVLGSASGSASSWPSGGPDRRCARQALPTGWHLMCLHSAPESAAGVMPAAVLSRNDRDCPRRGLCRAAATRSPGVQSYVFTRPHSDIKTPILGISDRYLRGVP